MAKFKLSLGKSNDVGERQILIRITVTRDLRLRWKTNYYVSEQYFDENANSIVPPRSSRLKSEEKKKVEKVKTDLQNYLARLDKIIALLIETDEKTGFSKSGTKKATDTIEKTLKLSEGSNTEDLSWELLSRKREEAKRAKSIRMTKCKKDFFTLAEEYISSADFSADHIKHLKVLFRSLARFEKFTQATKFKKFKLDIYELTSDDIDDFFWYINNEPELAEEYSDLFSELLRSYPVEISAKHKTPKLQKKGENTMSKYRKKLKAFFQWLNTTGKTTNDPCKNLKVGTETYGTPYYLTIEELNKISKWDFTHNKHLREQRDIFVFQCMVGCRVGDLIRLTENHIIGDWLQYMPNKTIGNQPKVIKVFLPSDAKSIIAEYKGKCCGKLLPFISPQKYNQAIKEILTVCEITRMVIVRNPKTGKEEQRPINELASSHMARRTFVGTLYEDEVDTAVISSMSGHAEGSRAFNRYRDVSDERKKKAILGLYNPQR